MEATVLDQHKDHPRLRRENKLSTLPDTYDKCIVKITTFRCRVTPAYAGNIFINDSIAEILYLCNFKLQRYKLDSGFNN